MSVDALNLASFEELRSTGKAHPKLSDIPTLDTFLDHLDHRNGNDADAIQPFSDGAIRAYQVDVIRDRGLSLPSPFTGDSISCARSHVFQDKIQVFAFHDREIFFVAAVGLAQGFRLSAIYFPKRALMINIGETVWGLQPRHLAVLDAMAAEAALPRSPHDSIVLLSGDQNYAHHIWNQIPALCAAVQSARTSGTTVRLMMTHEPLGPIHRLIPFLDPQDVIRCNDYDLEQFQRTHGTLILCPGSTRVDRHLAERFVSYCRENASEPVKEIIRRSVSNRTVRIWISVRTINRTIVNQREFLSRLVFDTLKAFEDCCVILDGFSYPDDALVPGRYDAVRLAQTAARDRHLAEEIIRTPFVQGATTSAHALVNAAGFSIIDSLALASMASAYFAHHGTVQHKVGWTSGVSGVVHANPDILGARPDAWAASQVEGSLPPVYLDADDVVGMGTGINDAVENNPYGNLDQIMLRDSYMFRDDDKILNVALYHFKRIVDGR